MQRTIEAIIHPDGTVEPIEALESPMPRRALLTILDEPPVGRPPHPPAMSAPGSTRPCAPPGCWSFQRTSRKSSSCHPKRSELRSHAVSHRERRCPVLS